MKAMKVVILQQMIFFVYVSLKKIGEMIPNLSLYIFTHIFPKWMAKDHQLVECTIFQLDIGAIFCCRLWSFDGVRIGEGIAVLPWRKAS